MDPYKQVRIILAAEREQGRNFDQAWYRAQRLIAPPAEAPSKVMSEHELTQANLRETKPHWRAAYERRLPTVAELEAGVMQAERRLDRLLLYDAALIAEREGAALSPTHPEDADDDAGLDELARSLHRDARRDAAAV